MARKSYATRRDKQQTSGSRSVFLAIGLLAALVILIGVLMSVRNRPTATPAGPARVGAAPSNFTLTDLSGKQVRLSDYAGRPVLINAWATWCPPCKAEMPALHDFYRAHQAEGFTLLAVNAGEAPAQVSSFIRQMGFTFPVLLDPNTAVLTELGVRGFPTSIIVGRDGTVKKIHTGILTANQLQTEIAPLLGR
jgi:peroxiredoxin